jgi:hypothetical protein
MTRDGAVRCACPDGMRILALALHGCRVTVYGASRRAQVMEGPDGMHSAPPTSTRTSTRR